MKSLDGIWDFVFLGDADVESIEVGRLAFADRMAVPGCFDATPAYAGRRGLAAYRTTTVLETGARYRLWLDGVQHGCRAFVAGKTIGGHSGGFTRFAFDFTAPSAAADLVVLVDNRFDSRNSPIHLDYFDWYQYGGIARGVELHRLSRVWMDGVRVVTRRVDPPEITVSMDYGAADSTGATDLLMIWDGREALRETVKLTAPKGRLERTLTLPGAALWSPSAPKLHLLDIRLGDDDWRERIGIRQVGTEDGRICINGEPVWLQGFNRHEAHPQFGHALPEAQLVADIQLLRMLGANFVRGSHYPQDRRFLDLCDEAGICVWSEATAWQLKEKSLTDPEVIDALLANQREMVAAAYNHPSVILWGVLNECESDNPKCRPAYARLLDDLRAADPSRPATYASCVPFTDTCLDLADVIAINCYPGWYGGSLETIPEDLDKIVLHLDENGCARKPLLISEIGAEGIYGLHDWNEDRWSEEYQAKLLEMATRHLFRHGSRVSGMAIWLLTDYRSAGTLPRVLGRARGFNNKGVLDEYRRPKQAFAALQRLFRE